MFVSHPLGFDPIGVVFWLTGWLFPGGSHVCGWLVSPCQGSRSARALLSRQVHPSHGRGDGPAPAQKQLQGAPRMEKTGAGGRALCCKREVLGPC